MAHMPIDLKLYSEVKDTLSRANNDNSMAAKNTRPLTGPFQYLGFPMAPKNPYDEVFPGIVLGEASMAMKINALKQLGITHVCNVSMGKLFSQTNTSSNFYKNHNIDFHGIPAMDVPTFQIRSYLDSAADFIDESLKENGKIYVHCQQGVSRSATIVLAFLMLKRNMDLLSAVKLVRQKREIYPNDGFLRQLCELSKDIGYSKTK